MIDNKIKHGKDMYYIAVWFRDIHSWDDLRLCRADYDDGYIYPHGETQKYYAVKIRN